LSRCSEPDEQPSCLARSSLHDSELPDDLETLCEDANSAELGLITTLIYIVDAFVLPARPMGLVLFFSKQEEKILGMFGGKLVIK
jgi:hypothetical protein